MMTIRVPFCFVDVFASRPLTGNPLPVVPDADGLDEAQMRAVAWVPGYGWRRLAGLTTPGAWRRNSPGGCGRSR